MVDIILRSLGTVIKTILIMLNTSIQYNVYGPSKKFRKLSQTRSLPLSEIRERCFGQYKEPYCKALEMFALIRDGRSLTSTLARRESSSLQILNRSCLTIVFRQAMPRSTFACPRLT